MNIFTQSRKTTYGAIVGVISIVAGAFGYTIEPTQAQLIASILVALNGIAIAIVGYFAPDADKVIDKVQKIAQVGEASQNEVVKQSATELDGILEALKTAINNQQTKVAEAQSAIQQVEQLKAQHASIITQLKQQLSL